MWLWHWLCAFFEGNSRFAAMAIAIFYLTVLSAVVGICLKSMGLYWALCLLFVGVGVVCFLSFGLAWEKLAYMLAVEGSAVGLGYAVAYVCLELLRIKKRRKEERQERKRGVQFTLPDRENRYLRDRLHTSLQTEEWCFQDRRSALARMSYARRMISLIKASPLTPVERIDVEEMARLLALYDKKGRWNGADVKALSEIFSRLLKLAAKYEIAV